MPRAWGLVFDFVAEQGDLRSEFTVATGRAPGACGRGNAARFSTQGKQRAEF